MAKPNVYLLSLASDCIKNTLNLWGIVATKYGQYAAIENLNKQIADEIFKMVVNQFAITNPSSFGFLDGHIVLISKIDEEQLIIQDIFMITLFRKFDEDWEKREIISDLINIIKLLTKLIKAAVDRNIYYIDSYIEAFYEISYLILRGLPKQYENDNNLKKDDLEFTKLKSVKEYLEKELFDCWSQLLTKLFTTESHLGLHWKQSLFAVIGVGIIRYDKTKENTLKLQLIELINKYLELCLKENTKRDQGIQDDSWDYLQLIGAWAFAFLEDENLAKNIAKVVAEFRPFYSSIIGLSSSEGRHGYPEVDMRSGFFLPWLRNLQAQNYLKKEEWDTFRLWQKKLMDKEILKSFYIIYDEFRKPLRDDFYKKIKEKRK